MANIRLEMDIIFVFRKQFHPSLALTCFGDVDDEVPGVDVILVVALQTDDGSVRALLELLILVESFLRLLQLSDERQTGNTNCSRRHIPGKVHICAP